MSKANPPVRPTEPSRAGANPPLVRLPSGSSGSEAFLPNDHVRMLVELLQPIGPELARRWLAALMLVDRGEREAMVSMIERQIAELYAGAASAGEGAGRSTTSEPKSLHVVHPPVQRDGHTEQVFMTYEVVDEAEPAADVREARPAGRGRRAR